MVCWTFCTYNLQGPDAPGGRFNKRRRLTYFTGRHRGTYIFAAMYVALTILLCIQLSEWAPAVKPGRCYHTQLTADTNASHPTADITYVATTAGWMVSAMASAIFLGPRRRRLVLISAFLQFPVHLYMAIALRSTNQRSVDGAGVSENSWDFGQTTAVVLLAVAVIELCSKGWGYFVFEHELRKRRQPPSESGAVGAHAHESGVEKRRES